MARRENPYSFPRGEFGVGISEAAGSVIVLTTKGAYRLEGDPRKEDVVLRPVPVERPKLRSVKE